MRLRICAGWSEPFLVAHTTLLEISCHGSNVICLLVNLTAFVPFIANNMYPAQADAISRQNYQGKNYWLCREILASTYNFGTYLKCKNLHISHKLTGQTGKQLFLWSVFLYMNKLCRQQSNTKYIMFTGPIYIFIFHFSNLLLVNYFKMDQDLLRYKLIEGHRQKEGRNVRH